jgi:prepilin signal peptidase PulO-like enzyme (type II secretory pathway)
MGLAFLSQDELGILYFILNYLLLCIAVIDIHSLIIPNVMLIPLVVIAVVKSVITSNNLILNLSISILVILILVIVNRYVNKIRNTDAIGYGDIKLLAIINVFFGYKIFFIGLWLSALIAIPGFYLLKSFSKNYVQAKKIPFGFFLFVGYLIMSVIGEHLISLLVQILEV